MLKGITKGYSLVIKCQLFKSTFLFMVIDTSYFIIWAVGNSLYSRLVLRAQAAVISMEIDDQIKTKINLIDYNWA